jgi:hypothetical protein
VQIHFLLIVDIPFLVSQQLFPCWFSHQPSKERIECYFDVPSYLFYTVGIMSFTFLPEQSADRLTKRWRLKTIERIFFFVRPASYVSLSRFWQKKLSWYFTPVHTKEKGVAPKFGSDKTMRWDHRKPSRTYALQKKVGAEVIFKLRKSNEIPDWYQEAL